MVSEFFSINIRLDMQLYIFILITTLPSVKHYLYLPTFFQLQFSEKLQNILNKSDTGKIFVYLLIKYLSKLF